MSLYVIADVTNPRSAPLELQATVPDYQIPFVPITQDGEEPFSMFQDLKGKYDWVMQPVKYPSFPVLQRVFKEAILERAWQKPPHKRKPRHAGGVLLRDVLLSAACGGERSRERRGRDRGARACRAPGRRQR